MGGSRRHGRGRMAAVHTLCWRWPCIAARPLPPPFAQAAAILKAEVYGVARPEWAADTKACGAAAAKLDVPKFVPQKGVKIETDPKARLDWGAPGAGLVGPSVDARWLVCFGGGRLALFRVCHCAAPCPKLRPSPLPTLLRPPQKEGAPTSNLLADDDSVIDQLVGQLSAATKGLPAGYKLNPITFEKARLGSQCWRQSAPQEWPMLGGGGCSQDARAVVRARALMASPAEC